MDVQINVSSREGDFTFSCRLHTPTGQKEFHLDPCAFYLEWGKEIPTLPHHEVEVTSPDRSFLRRHGAHIHQSRINEGLAFMCYPHRLATPEEALEIFKRWCLGTVTGIVEGIDLNDIVTQCNNHGIDMETALKQRFGISIKP